jgi:hypothetical protein
VLRSYNRHETPLPSAPGIPLYRYPTHTVVQTLYAWHTYTECATAGLRLAVKNENGFMLASGAGIPFVCTKELGE